MAKTASTNKAILSWKRKKWFEILAPRIFYEQPVGETIAAEPEMVVGRTSRLNLMILTKDIKKQNIDVTFKVKEVKGLKAYTEFFTYEMIPSSIKRLVRKGRERVDDSFLAVTKDGRTVRVKPLIICRNLVARSVTTDIKNATRKMTADILQQIDYDTFIKDIITGKFQRAIKMQMNKIYPIKTADIRVAQLVK